MGLSTKGPITAWEGSWAEGQIKARGERAALNGIPYADNPERSPEGRLAWSQGHNNARVVRAIFRDRNGWG